MLTNQSKQNCSTDYFTADHCICCIFMVRLAIHVTETPVPSSSSLFNQSWMSPLSQKFNSSISGFQNHLYRISWMELGVWSAPLSEWVAQPEKSGGHAVLSVSSQHKAYRFTGPAVSLWYWIQLAINILQLYFLCYPCNNSEDYFLCVFILVSN